jgi:GntR family transcriptional repressor for pyruvate dehydrogenase complex
MLEFTKVRPKAGKSTIESKLRKVARTSISEEIADQIMNLVSSGALKPGEKLPSERKLCENFGVGRSSLREAIRCLAIMGVLNVRVGDGTTLAADGDKFLRKACGWRMITEQQDVENLLEVRLGLECATAAAAAHRHSAAQLKAIEALLRRMKRTIGDAKAFANLDLDFHLTIAEASGNPLMHDLLSMIRSQLVLGLARVVTLPGGTTLAYRQHATIVTALRNRDASAASEAMQIHIDSAIERYRKSQTNGLS